MGDLVKRLRSGLTHNNQTWPEMCNEAADVIESLTARLADAEEALRGNAAFIKAQAEERARIEAERDRLKAALGRIAETDLLEIAGYHTRKWCIPETGSEYESRDPVFKRSAFQNAQDFQRIAKEALDTQENTDG
jgi:hypothetical protein